MSKMKEVATILGVKVGEEFGISIDENIVCRITEEWMEYRALDGDVWREIGGTAFRDLIREKITIIKKPWKPKKGEQYWCATTHCGAPQCEWQDRMSDLAYYAVGNCFRTEEEAEAHTEEVLARLKKIYDEGTPLIQ